MSLAAVSSQPTQTQGQVRRKMRKRTPRAKLSLLADAIAGRPSTLLLCVSGADGKPRAEAASTKRQKTPYLRALGVVFA